MNKTLRTSSLPHLKYPLQTIHKTNIRPISTVQKVEAKEQVVKVGSYLIDKKQLLGRGFCSQVYKGLQTETGLNVAVKLIQFDQVKGTIEKRLLKNQIKNWNQIKNQPNILKLHDIVTTKQSVAFVSQLCNQNLLQILRPKKTNKKQPLKKEQALKIIKQILVGYSSMKRHNILHRDIKPANILINQNGQACLADFGFSIKKEEVQKDTNINIGSPLYMAPQVLKGNCYSSKADIWAIGLIFMQMLIGDLPWFHVKELNLYEELKKIEIGSVIPSEIQEKYKQFLQKCLQFDPRQRIGVRQAMEYFFTKEEISENENSQENLYNYKCNNKAQEIIDVKFNTNKQKPKEEKSNISNLYKSHRLNSIIPRKTLYTSSTEKLSNSPNYIVRTVKTKQQLRQNQALVVKLRVKGSQHQQAVLHQKMSEVQFCRFLFKVIQLIVKGQQNIHYTYLEINQQVLIKLAETILYTLSEVKSVKSELNSTNLLAFKKSKQHKQIIQLINQYQNNYRQFFDIQLSQKIVAHQVNFDYLRQLMHTILTKGKQHLQLILQEVEKSKLKIIHDHQISQFTYLIGNITKLVSLLRLKKKDRQHYLKHIKIEDLPSQSTLQSITLFQMRKIYQKMQI